MYHTEEISGTMCHHTVRMSFELSYPDWCKFRNSEIFRQLTNCLEEFEKQDTCQRSQDD